TEVIRGLTCSGVRQWNHVLQSESCLAQPAGRDEVIHKGRPVPAQIVSRIGIVDGAQAIEVGATDLSSRNAQDSTAAFRGCCALPGHEEEELVVFDGTAERTAELIVNALRRLGTGGSVGIEEEVFGSPITIDVIFEGYA